MKKLVSLVSVLFILVSASGQQGSPLLTHYTESRDIENQNWAICQDEFEVMLFANRKGILTFDGEDWSLIRIPTIPYSIQKNPADGKIYIGGYNNFGYLERDQTGSYAYLSLSGNLEGIGVISKIICRDSLVWFYGENTVIRFNAYDNVFDFKIDARHGFPYTGLIVTPQNTFVNVFERGLFRIDSDTLFPIVTGYLTINDDILFSLPYNNKMMLVGFGGGKLSLFDGIKYYDYKIKDEEYLRENILSDGIALGDTAYAFSTLEGGAIVVGKTSRAVLFTINNQNELPDDEVFAVGSDDTGGLWLSHQYGLTRADLNLPAANYSIFPGLKGNLSSALRYKNELYVATSEGVYYLAEVKNYTEVEILIKKEPPVTSVVTTPNMEDIRQDSRSNRTNIFSRILGRRAYRTMDIEVDLPEEQPVAAEIKPVEQYTWKTISKLKSIDYIYKKVSGMNEKCRQLVSTPYGILAATNKGLYSINDHKATLVTPGRYINFISWHPVGSKYYVGSTDGYFSVNYMNGKWRTELPDAEFYYPVYTIFQKDSRTLWLGTDNAAFRASLGGYNEEISYFQYEVSNDFPARYILKLINDTVFVLTESGIHYYKNSADSLDKYRPGFSEYTNVFYPLSNHSFARVDHEWISLDSEQQINERELSLLKIFDDVVSITMETDNLWVIDGNNRLFGIDRKKFSRVAPAIDVFIKSISSGKGTKFALDDIKFEPGDNVINFDIIAPGYLKQNTTQYQYFIDKIMTDWSPWSERTNYDRTISKPGVYTLKVRAKDLWGNIGEPQSVDFIITAPFTRKPVFYVILGLLLLSLVIFIIRLREKQLLNKNKLLEEKVQERTSEIEAQKQEITSSIEYASRIQEAMLPMEDHFKASFADYFIIFKPRDIVSGDFYWIGEDDKSILFTVADCTGHGVPGAFMSTMGISTLNEIIANNRHPQPNKILNLLRKKTMTALHQTGRIGEAADGMDIAFCVLDKTRTKLQFSGAFNPLFIFQQGELKEYKADRMPIGIHYGKEISFTNYVINVSRGDTLYIFSDGFASQFGGPEGTKFKKGNLRKLISEIYFRPMVEQKNILLTEFEKWKGCNDQVDDITMIGIKI